LLSFYAYIGFEDIVNVAEEVKNPVRIVPRAILLSLGIAAILYFLVSLVSVLSVTPAVLAQSDAPLALLYQQITGGSPLVITAISVVSVTNGALVQIIMASRLIHGMQGMGWGHRHLGFIHPVTSTPVVSISVVTLIVLVFALSLETVSLAKITSFITLAVFTIINLALWRIKLQQPDHKGYTVPLWVPVSGFFCSAGFVVYQFI
jgi:basic amino acid/polyamine antiporter, APA family